jgi:uncharacterized protein (DUF983 family)
MTAAPDPPEQSPPRPPLRTLILRGLTRRCPWCADRRAYFTGWFHKQERCRRCGMPWRRGDVGFELGAATINTIITFGVVIVGVAVGVIATSPDVAVVPIVLILVATCIVVPILIYPITYTLWQALDIAMRGADDTMPRGQPPRRAPSPPPSRPPSQPPP